MIALQINFSDVTNNIFKKYSLLLFYDCRKTIWEYEDVFAMQIINILNIRRSLWKKIITDKTISSRSNIQIIITL